MDYRVIITVYSSSKEYPPINFAVQVSEALAKMLMATPVGKIGIAVERSGGIVLDKTRLLDFK